MHCKASNPIPRNTIAKLLLRHNGKDTFIGSCFAFPTPVHFLTAAHCVAEHSASTILLDATFQGVLQKVKVKRICCHPAADLALLEVATSPWAPATPFNGVRTDPLLGEPFYVFGYSLDIFSHKPDEGTDRLFRGHFQRLISYSSPLAKTTYPAFELNIPCPGGLSGSPVFVTENEYEVMGLVTENLESTSYRSEEESLTTDGSTERIVHKNMITYGIALQLGPYVDWINETINLYK